MNEENQNEESQVTEVETEVAENATDAETEVAENATEAQNAEAVPAEVPEVAPEKRAPKAKKAKIKKKRGFCFHCCMSLLIFNFVCTCLLVGVGWFFGDQYCKQYLDMSLSETFGVVTGLTRSNGRFIDKNHAPQKEDEANFYNSLGNALFLKKGALDPEELKEAVVDEIKGETVPDYDSGEEISPLVNYLGDLMSSENFNDERINSIDENNPEAYNLRVPDYEVAAFINGVVGTMIDSFVVDEIGKDAADMGVDMSKISVKDYVKIEQLKFEVKPKEVNGSPKDVTTLGVTASVGFGKLLSDVKKSLDVDKFIESISEGASEMEQFKSLISFGLGTGIGMLRTILPNKLYVSLEMGLSDNVSPRLNINNMSDAKMEKLYGLLKKVDLDVKTELDKVFVDEEGAVKNAIDDINATVPLKDIVKDGEINCDAYQLALDLSGVNEDQPENEKITSKDVLQLLKIVLGNNDEYVEEIKSSNYSYKNVKLKKDADGKYVFDKDGLPVIEDQGKQYYVTGKEELDELLDDYEALLMQSLDNAYGLKADSIEQLIDTFVPPSGESVDPDRVLELFDTNKIKDIMKGEADGVVITDKMLAALITKLLPKILENGGTPATVAAAEDPNGEETNILDAIGIEFICIKSEEDDKNYDHKILDLAVSIDLPKLVGDALEGIDPIAKKIVNNLLPDNMIVEAEADITFVGDVKDYKGDPDKFPFFATSLKINGNNAQAVDKLLAVFGVLGTDENGNKMGIGDYLDKNVLGDVRDALFNMKNLLPGLSIEESKLKLPDVYEAIAVAVNQGKGSHDYVDPNQLESVLELIMAPSPLDEEDNDYRFYVKPEAEAYYTECSEALLTELETKYGLSLKTASGRYSLEQVLRMLGVIEPNDSGAAPNIYDLIDADKLRDVVSASDGWQNDLKVKITNVTYLDNEKGLKGTDMLTALVREIIKHNKIGIGDMVVNENNLLFVKVEEIDGKRYMNMVTRFNITDLLPDNSSANVRDFIEQFLPDDLPGGSNSLIEIKVSLDSDEDCKFVFNNNPTASEDLIKLLKNLVPDLDFESVGDSVRKAIKSLETNNNVGVQLTADGMELDNLFALVSGGLGKDGSVQAEDVKFFLDKILNSDPIDAPQNYDFRNWYYTSSDKHDMQYGSGSEQLKVDFGEILNSKLLDAYALTSASKGGEPYTLADTMAMFGLSNGATTDIMSRIDGNKFENLVFADIAPTEVESRELGALITATLSDFISGDIISSDDIMYVAVGKKENGHKYLTIGVTMDVSDKLGSASGGAKDLVGKLLPEGKSTLVVTIDISDGDHDDTEVKFNNCTAEETNRLLGLIKKISSTDAIDINGLSGSVRTSLGKISDKIGLDYGEDTLNLPDIFTVVNKLVLKTDAKSEDIQGVMKRIYATSDSIEPGSDISRRQKYEQTIVGHTSDDYNGFIEKIMDCYFFSEGTKNAVLHSTGNKFESLYNQIGKDGFASMIDVKGPNGLAHTNKSLDELTPVIPAADLSAIMREHMPNDMGVYAVNTYDNRIELYVSVALDKLFSGNEDMSKLLSVRVLYVKLTAYIDRATENGYECDITVNSMDEAQKDLLFEIISNFGAVGEDDFEKLESDVGVAIREALSIVEDACGEGNLSVTDEGIRLVDVFTLLASKITDGKDGTAVRKVIQGMYESESATSSQYNYNFKANEFVLNTVSNSSDITPEKLFRSAALDKDLGAYVNANLRDENINDVTVEQFSILAATPSQGSLNSQDREKFGALTRQPLDAAKNYVLITVKTDVAKMGNVADVNMGDLLPDEMYVTFIVEFNATATQKFSYVDLIINNMDSETKQLLFEMTKIDRAEQAIGEIVEQCTAPINDLLARAEELAEEWSSHLPGGLKINHKFSEAKQGEARGQYTII